MNQNPIKGLLQSQLGQSSPILVKIVMTLIVLIVALILVKTCKVAIKKRMGKLKAKSATMLPLLQSLASYTIYLLALIIILDLYGVSTTSLLTVLGSVGLAIGFALKDTLSNIASGLMLLYLRPFNVDDTIQAGAITGKVIEINLFSTVIESADGVFITAPNSSIASGSITNFSRNPKRRAMFDIGIAYSDSIEKGIETLLSLANQNEKVLKDPAPQALVVALADSSVNLQLRCWMKTEDYWPTFWQLNRQIKSEIEQAGLNIPFPHRELIIRKEDLPLS